MYDRSYIHLIYVHQCVCLCVFDAIENFHKLSQLFRYVGFMSNILVTMARKIAVLSL